MSAWQRQTLYFGHEKGYTYSSLVYDNRGIGLSDKPVMRYSTCEMAKDIIEILDHIGWTETRQLHIMGVSMGGMIAQELACLIPDRICSLNLLSTAAGIKNTVSFLENLRNRVNMFIPKSLDRTISDAAQSLFPDSWLEQRDATRLPTASTPGCRPPKLPATHYGEFDTNFERFAAQELSKRLDSEQFQRTGFVLQAIAAGWHHKSPMQLKEMADSVGRERILVMHGTEDKMISVPHGRKLVDMIRPGRVEIVEGSGHVLMLERSEWHNGVIEQMVEKTEAMAKA